MPDLAAWIPDLYPRKINSFVANKKLCKIRLEIVDLPDDTIKLCYRLLVGASLIVVVDFLDHWLNILLRMAPRGQKRPITIPEQMAGKFQKAVMHNDKGNLTAKA
jgi:hypothetical protein